jgi:carboxypeptidase Taq
VRVTTRVNRRDFLSALSSSVHEGGHALYEQGFPLRYRRTLLADAPSLGMHESQSRLWENVIGRSLPFWRHYTPGPLLFPCAPEDLSPEQVWRAANRVEPSLIRVEADECTYNLHIILRFEIETALIEGSIEAEHVPELWNERMRLYSRARCPTTRGAAFRTSTGPTLLRLFPDYALGNLYAAQLLEKMEQDMPNLWDGVARGSSGTSLAGCASTSMPAAARSQRTGFSPRSPKAPDAGAFLRYLEEKYAALYGLG